MNLTLLMLSGAGHSAIGFDLLARWLARLGVRCAAINLRGKGLGADRSSWSRSIDAATTLNAVADTLRVLDHRSATGLLPPTRYLALRHRCGGIFARYVAHQRAVAALIMIQRFLRATSAASYATFVGDILLHGHPGLALLPPISRALCDATTAAAHLAGSTGERNGRRQMRGPVVRRDALGDGRYARACAHRHWVARHGPPTDRSRAGLRRRTRPDGPGARGAPGRPRNEHAGRDTCPAGDYAAGAARRLPLEAHVDAYADLIARFRAGVAIAAGSFTATQRCPRRWNQ